MSKAHLPSSPLTIGNGSGHSFSPICTVRRSPSPSSKSCFAAPSLIAASVSSVFSSALSLTGSRPSSVATASEAVRLKRLLEGVERRLRRVEDRRIEVRRERSDLGYGDIRRRRLLRGGRQRNRHADASAAAQTERRRPADRGPELRAVLNILVMVLSSRSSSACVRRHRRRHRAAAAAAAGRLTCLWPPPPRLAAAHRLVAAVGTAPWSPCRDSTLPSPEGFFGRLSTLAAGFGLPALRLAVGGLAAGAGWPTPGLPAGRLPRRASWPACSQPGRPGPSARRACSCGRLASRAGLARPPVGDLVALLDVAGAVANGIVAVRARSCS